MEIESKLLREFPGLQTLELYLCDLSIKESDLRLNELKERIQDETKAKIKSLDEVRDREIFRAYRDFFWRVGIDPTKIRPAGEALTRRVLNGKSLPQINTLVDSYNLASLETSVAIAAFDAAKISKDKLFMRRAKERELFLGIGMDSPLELRGVEVVIEDAASRKLIAVYPYRDSEESKVRLETRDVLLLMCGVPGVGLESLEHAKLVAKDYIQRFHHHSK